MGNKKKNKNYNRQNPNKITNTEVLNTQKEKTDGASEKKSEENTKSNSEAVPKNIVKDTKEIKAETQQKSEKPEPQKIAAPQKNEKAAADNKIRQDAVKKEPLRKEESKREELKKEESRKEELKREPHKREDSQKGKVDFSSEQFKGSARNAAKILLPVAACAIIIAVIISTIGSKESRSVDNQSLNVDADSDAVSAVTLSDEPLDENAFTDVNELMRAFYTAMADGDMDTVKALKDYNTDKEIITYKEKSEFIESYDNINCYTKPGMEENSYFVYVTYDVKIRDIETKAPGLNAFYVYTAEDGSLKIDGDTEENIKAAFKLVTNQDDVVDLYNKIDVSYKEATASDEALDQFMEELPDTIRESVGVALAQLAAQDESSDTPQTEAAAENGETQPAETEVSGESEEPLENKVVNQIVRTTDTVNVRSSDSEEADKIGKAQAGTELTRIEDRVNGWSKVIFEDREAFIKSDYLEVITTEVTVEPIGTVTATTNVNIRSQASQESEKLGTAQAGNSYNLLEDQGEWYKIEFDGKTGFVKAEFFER